MIDKDIAETVIAVIPRVIPDPADKRPFSLYHNTILMGYFPSEEAALAHSVTLLQDSHDERGEEVKAGGAVHPLVADGRVLDVPGLPDAERGG